MKKVFFDANIIIDLLNTKNENHLNVAFIFRELLRNKCSLYISPTTFAISYYFLGKALKDTKKLNYTIAKFFSDFNFTREDNIIMGKVFQSDFIDLEDALQYYSAFDAGVDAIITYDYYGFVNTSVPVYHPIQYIHQFLL